MCPAHFKLFGTKGPDGVFSDLQEVARTVRGQHVSSFNVCVLLFVVVIVIVVLVLVVVYPCCSYTLVSL